MLSCVHIDFDRNCSPSIKDYEHSLIGVFMSDHAYVSSGSEHMILDKNLGVPHLKKLLLTSD